MSHFKKVVDKIVKEPQRTKNYSQFDLQHVKTFPFEACKAVGL